MLKKVIITDHLHPYLEQQLTKLGYEVDVQQDITNEQLFEIIDQYFCLVLSTKIKVTPALLDKATKLVFIARAGSGMENIDIEYARAKNIQVINSPEGNSNAVAEHAVGTLLALINNITRSDREIRAGIWRREQNRGIELEGKTIGIIGYGNTGSAFALKLQSFNMQVLAYDKFRSGFGSPGVKESDLAEIKEKADIVSFHLPLTDETFHFLDDAFISDMRKNFWVINTSRGKVVDSRSLLKGLISGKILGAGLDVFENEQFYQLKGDDKLIMEKMCSFENIILTPHIAGWTHESYFKISKILAERIEVLTLPNVK